MAEEEGAGGSVRPVEATWLVQTPRDPLRYAQRIMTARLTGFP